MNVRTVRTNVALQTVTTRVETASPYRVVRYFFIVPLVRAMVSFLQTKNQ